MERFVTLSLEVYLTVEHKQRYQSQKWHMGILRCQHPCVFDMTLLQFRPPNAHVLKHWHPVCGALGREMSEILGSRASWEEMHHMGYACKGILESDTIFCETTVSSSSWRWSLDNTGQMLLFLSGSVHGPRAKVAMGQSRGTCLPLCCLLECTLWCFLLTDFIRASALLGVTLVRERVSK